MRIVFTFSKTESSHLSKASPGACQSLLRGFNLAFLKELFLIKFEAILIVAVIDVVVATGLCPCDSCVVTYLKSGLSYR